MMDLQDQAGPKESEDLLDCQDSQEHQDFRVCREEKDLQAREGRRDATGQKVTEAFQEAQESPAFRGCRVRRVCRDQRETPGT